MPLPTFTDKTDGLDIVYAADVNNLQNEVAPTAAASAHVRYSTSITSTATTLTDASMPVQSIASTASATMTLPAVSTSNHPFFVVNRSTANTVTVNNASAAFVAYARPASVAMLFPDSTAGWYGVSTPKYSTSTTPTNYLREDGTFSSVATTLSTTFAPLTGSTAYANVGAALTSFTPYIFGTSSTGTGSYTTQVGYYYKIDSVVYYSINLNWTSHTGTGNLAIGGLPFTIHASVAAIGSVLWSSVTLSAVGNKLIGECVPNTTQISFFEIGSAAIVAVPIDTSALIYITGFYFV